MTKLINRPAFLAWVATVRFLAQVGIGIKATATAEDMLDIRLQLLFNRVNAEVATQIENRGGNIPGIMRNATAPMSDIIYEEVRKVDSNLNPRVQAQLRDYAFEASKRTMDRMTFDVMENLSQAYSEGLGTIEAADRISADFKDMQDWELKRVARTEVNSAQGLNNYDRMQTAGVRFIQWVTAEDERVRQTKVVNHRKLHGQIVRVGNKFSNGLLHPGDRTSRKLAEFIDCRCVAVPFIMPLGFIAPGDGSVPFYENELVSIKPINNEVILDDDSRNKNAQLVSSKLNMRDAKRRNIQKYDPKQVDDITQDIVKNFNSEISNGLVEGLEEIRFADAKLSKRVLGELRQSRILGKDVLYMRNLEVFKTYDRMSGTLIHEMGRSVEHMFGVTRGSYGHYGKGRLLYDNLSPGMKKKIDKLGVLAKEGFKRQKENVKSVMGDKVYNSIRGRKQWYFEMPDNDYDIITEYSLANDEEFFCESLKMYKLNPKLLSRLHPDLFNAIRDTLFDGRGF